MKINELQNFRTLYAHRNVIGPDDFFNWVNSRINTEIPKEKFHVTVAYSKAKVDWNKIPYKTDTLVINPDPNRTITKFDTTLVLLLNSSDLQNRWQEFMNNGASYDFDEYRPHISLTYQDNGIEITDVYSGPLYLGSEQYETVNEEWTPNE